MEHHDLIAEYVRLLEVWNKKINLIQSNDMARVMTRHILDCVQISQYLDRNHTILDIGSGAGLPGIILSIHGFQKVILCEKSSKKATFLREVRAKLRLPFEVHQGDVFRLTRESKILKKAQEITLVARAFGHLKDLLDIMVNVSATKGVFQKGARLSDELAEAQKLFEFKRKIHLSKTDETGAIVEVTGSRKLNSSNSKCQ